MPDLPSGTVTFLFTDIEGSIALWERDRAAIRGAGRSPGSVVVPTRFLYGHYRP
jgi:hypothetical protein